MALKAPGASRIRVQVLDAGGGPLGRPSTYVAGASWRIVLAFARYWRDRGNCRVRVSDDTGKRDRMFQAKRHD